MKAQEITYMLKKIIEIIGRATDSWAFVIILGICAVAIAVWAVYMGLFQ